MAIEIKDGIKEYGYGKKGEKRSVGMSGVNLRFPEKGLVIIRGESGSGKSTLLNILSASDYLTGGKYISGGKEITAKNADEYRRKNVSVIYQDFRLIDDISVYDNVSLALQASGREPKREEIIGVLERVGIAEYEKKLPCELSGGEMQRCAIARAVAKKDAVILADEPTGNLDKKNGTAVMELLKELSAERLVVIVSHNAEFNEKYGDYYVTFEDGNVTESTLPESEVKEEREDSTEKVKTKLTVRTIFKLAGWSLRRGKTWAVLIVTTLMIAFIAFMTPMYVLDKTGAVGTTINNSDMRQVIVSTNKYDIDESKVADMCGHCLPVISGINKTFDINGEPQEPQKYFDFNGTERFIFTEKPSDIDCEIVAGKFPEKCYEIALSYPYAEKICAKGETAFAGNSMTIDRPEDVVGQTFYLNETINYRVKVSGLFDPKYGISKDKEYTDTEYERAQSDPMLGAVICNKGFLDIYRYYATEERVRSVYGEFDVPLYVYGEAEPFADEIEELGGGEAIVSKSFAESENVKEGDTISLGFKKYVTKRTKEGYKIVPVTLVEGRAFTVRKIVDGDADSVYISKDAFYGIEGKSAKDAVGFSINLRGYNARSVLRKIDRLAGGDSYEVRGGYVISDYPVDYSAKGVESINNFYGSLRQYKFMLLLPILSVLALIYFFMCIALCGIAVLQKERSIAVMRTIGFGRLPILCILAVQIGIMLIAEFAIGLILAAIINKVLATLMIGGGTLLAIGWQAVLTVVVIPLVVVPLTLFCKLSRLYAKPVNEQYRTSD